MKHALLILCLPSLVMAMKPIGVVDWTYEGTSGFTLQVYKGGPGNGDEQLWNAVTDHQYFGLWAAAVDPQGNVYFTAGDIRNLIDGSNPTYPGGSNGFTIMKPNGNGGWTQINVDLSSNPGGLNLRGGVTKMVVGGDGHVYALQNWMPPPYNWHWRPFWMLPGANWATGGCDVCANLLSRILRIKADGSVDVIVEYSPAEHAFPAAENPKWLNHIKGLDVGPDGHIYWWFAGTRWNAAGSWSQHVLWRYNVNSQAIEESPTAGTNNGWNDISQMVNFACVGTSAGGETWFARIRGYASQNKVWHLNPMGWSSNRTEAVNQADPSTFGHQYVLHLVYDSVLNCLWAGGWSPNEGSNNSATTNVMTRWNGVVGAGSLFTDELDENNARYGIQSVDAWHANGNNPQMTGLRSGGPYWIGAMALNPKDRAVWVSWGASDTIRHGTYNYDGEFGPAGNVYTINPGGKAPALDQGNPQASHPDEGKAANPSRTVALTFTDTKVYATTVDLVTREFNLFSADIPDPAIGACCTAGPACQETTEPICGMLGGIWQGDSSSCEQAICRYQVCSEIWADADGDQDVDMTDFAFLQACISPAGEIPEYPPYRCKCFDRDGNDAIGLEDLAAFAECAGGPGMPPVGDCAP